MNLFNQRMSSEKEMMKIEINMFDWSENDKRPIFVFKEKEGRKEIVQEIKEEKKPVEVLEKKKTLVMEKKENDIKKNDIVNAQNQAKTQSLNSPLKEKKPMEKKTQQTKSMGNFNGTPAENLPKTTEQTKNVSVNKQQKDQIDPPNEMMKEKRG